MYIMIICHWAILHYNMSFKTIARSDGVFWWFPALSVISVNSKYGQPTSKTSWLSVYSIFRYDFLMNAHHCHWTLPQMHLFISHFLRFLHNPWNLSFGQLIMFWSWWVVLFCGSGLSVELSWWGIVLGIVVLVGNGWALFLSGGELSSWGVVLEPVTPILEDYYFFPDLSINMWLTWDAY